MEHGLLSLHGIHCSLTLSRHHQGTLVQTYGPFGDTSSSEHFEPTSLE